MPRALSLGLTVLVLACLIPTAAYGTRADCGRSGKRWVAVVISGPGFTTELADSVLTDLRTELARHGVEACPADTQGRTAPLVTMQIEARQSTSIHLSLDVSDPSNGKPTERDLELDTVPPDGHSLAVAVAADELLNSSWVKLSSPPQAEPAAPQRPAPPPPTPPIPAEGARSAPQPSPRADARLRHELALLAAVECFGGASCTPGLDLAIRRWILPHWALELTGGGRIPAEDDAPHGRLRSRAFPGSLRMLAGLLPFAASARAGVAVALTATPLVYSAEPEPGAVAHSQIAVSLYGRAELWGDVALGSFRLRVCAGTGAPLRSVSADDSGVPGGGARGIELHAQAGLALEL